MSVPSRDLRHRGPYCGTWVGRHVWCVSVPWGTGARASHACARVCVLWGKEKCAGGLDGGTMPVTCLVPSLQLSHLPPPGRAQLTQGAGAQPASHTYKLRALTWGTDSWRDQLRATPRPLEVSHSIDSWRAPRARWRQSLPPESCPVSPCPAGPTVTPWSL